MSLMAADTSARLTASRNQRWTLVHQPIVNPSRFLVAGIAGLQKLSAEAVAKIRRRSGNRSNCRHDTTLSLFERLFHRELARSKRKEFS